MKISELIRLAAERINQDNWTIEEYFRIRNHGEVDLALEELASPPEGLCACAFGHMALHLKVDPGKIHYAFGELAQDVVDANDAAFDADWAKHNLLDLAERVEKDGTDMEIQLGT